MIPLDSQEVEKAAKTRFNSLKAVHAAQVCPDTRLKHENQAQRHRQGSRKVQKSLKRGDSYVKLVEQFGIPAEGRVFICKENQSDDDSDDSRGRRHKPRDSLVLVSRAVGEYRAAMNMQRALLTFPKLIRLNYALDKIHYSEHAPRTGKYKRQTVGEMITTTVDGVEVTKPYLGRPPPPRTPRGSISPVWAKLAGVDIEDLALAPGPPVNFDPALCAVPDSALYPADLKYVQELEKFLADSMAAE